MHSARMGYDSSNEALAGDSPSCLTDVIFLICCTECYPCSSVPAICSDRAPVALRPFLLLLVTSNFLLLIPVFLLHLVNAFKFTAFNLGIFRPFLYL